MARSRLLAVLAFVAALLVVAAPAAQAAPTTDPADAAAGWLAGQLTDGSHFVQDFGDAGVFPDQGLTLDAVLAFAAAGSGADSATAAMAWLGSGTLATDYFGDGTSFSDAGRLAKVAYAALVTGTDPHDVGGVDVLARLSAQLTASGRFSDLPANFDASNAFGQAFALLALARTPAGVPPSAVAFLAGSECPDGGFPLDYGQPACTPDTDATAMVVQALAVPGGDAAAAARGTAWLLSRQGQDGSFSGTGPTDAPNANSTGLAAQALRAAGDGDAADAAVAWLRARQLGCTAPAGQQGAVAYDSNGFDTGNVVRATAQAVLGLAGVSLGELTLDGAAGPVSMEARSILQHDTTPFTVCGVLEQTGTPIDRALFITLLGEEAMHFGWTDGTPPAIGKALPKLDVTQLHVDQITSFLLGSRSRISTLYLQREINTYKPEPLTAIIPAYTLQQVWVLLDYADEAFSLMSGAVLVVGLLTMLVSLYSTLNERRREIAILRAVGVSHGQIVLLFVMEAVLIATIGVVLGFLAVYLFLLVAHSMIEQWTGMPLRMAGPSHRVVLYGVVTIVLSAFVGLVPAWRAYRSSLQDGLRTS